MPIQETKKRKFNCLNFFQKFTYIVVTYTELFFYKLGVSIGGHPIKTIAICWIVVFISACGFAHFRQEKNPLKLWVPPHTTFIKDSEWLMSHLQKGYRDEAIMITADDVLEPSIIRNLAEVDWNVRNTKHTINHKWLKSIKYYLELSDVCFKIPKVDKSLLEYIESDKYSDTDADPSLQVPPELFCGFVEAIQKECYTKSILGLWDFNRTKIDSLTKEEIVNAVNNYRQDAVFGKLKSIEDLLGGTVRNESGHIIAATALQNFWYLYVNFAEVDMDVTGNAAGTADWSSVENILWEGMYLEIMRNASQYLNQTYFYYAGRSFGDISNATMFQDIDKLVISILLMIIYVQFVISKFNWLEARIVLGFMGLLTIGMAFVVGVGLCSLFGVFYGPVHTSLPFLLMGLGVDDMFVIMSCWDELTKEEKKLAMPERIGLMLKHAGVSITITSLTDVIAFIIGSSTILPCLESFCIYAAIGVLMTFIFAITFFVACFVLDQRRIESKRNMVICCIIHKNYEPNACSQKQISNKVFKMIYSNIILTVPGKVIVILFTVICVAFSTESTLRLEQRFDPKWFLPEGTHLARYLEMKNIYYPDHGFDAGLYIGALNYSHEMNNLREAVEQLQSMGNITMNVVSWVHPLRNFILVNFKHDLFIEPLDDDSFNIFLSKFLHSPRYAKYQANFIFDGELKCGAPAPKIKVSTIDFHFRRFENPRDQIPAMHAVRSIAEQANFTTGDKFATVWSKFFATWITDELIDIEVMRNLQLALLCVMLCTILLIADWQICFWIFVCVLFTMVNVCGFMQRWGLTIDLVSCIGLELAIGLCVDYATHVGHTFLTIHDGSKQDRAIRSVSTIGSAVLYGGLSTFIGISLMSQSKAYTFQSFFKIFSLVITFGLFHGLVFLPVILSWVGPKPYRQVKAVPHNDFEMASLT